MGWPLEPTTHRPVAPSAAGAHQASVVALCPAVVLCPVMAAQYASNSPAHRPAPTASLGVDAIAGHAADHSEPMESWLLASGMSQSPYSTAALAECLRAAAPEVYED